MLKCDIEPALLGSSDSWNVNEQSRKNLEAAELWFLRWMLTIPWTARVSNNDCVKQNIIHNHKEETSVVLWSYNERHRRTLCWLERSVMEESRETKRNNAGWSKIAISSPRIDPEHQGLRYMENYERLSHKGRHMMMIIIFKRLKMKTTHFPSWLRFHIVTW